MILSESYRRTIMLALAHENTPAAIETISELGRLGWHVPAWIRADIERYGRIAGWNLERKAVTT